MKKRMFSLFLVLILCMSMAMPAMADSTGLVRDGAGLLTARAESELEEELERISREHGTDVIVVTVDTVGNRLMDSFTEDYYDSEFGPDHDGIMLLIAMEEREYRILSNGFGAKAVSNSDIDNFCEHIEPYLRDGDYAAAFRRFARDCDTQLYGEIHGFPFPFGYCLGISLAAGAVIGLAAVLGMAFQLRSTGRRRTAQEYTRSGSFRLTGSSDIYLYRNLTRRPRQDSSSGSGRSSGGSSRNMGGGRF